VAEVTVLALMGSSSAPIEGASPVRPIDGDAPLATRTCAAIAQLAPTPPLAVIAPGAAAELLPAIALAQRTAGRPILGYLLIDPPAAALRPSTEQWPDARVTVHSSDEGVRNLARLRGWDIADAAVPEWIAEWINGLGT